MAQLSRGELPNWQKNGLRYYRLNYFFQEFFGHRVWKVTLDAGFHCPNRDGTIGTGGCAFCNMESFSPNKTWNVRLDSLREQLDYGIEVLSRTYTARKFLAYFQPATNTYAPVEELRRFYTEALDHPQICGLIVGTRPDCVGDDVLDLLAELAEKTWVSLELGVQSIFDRSLERIHRGHTYADSEDAFRRAKQRGLNLCAHVVLGLPGETPDDFNATAEALAKWDLQAVKIHNLYVPHNTELAGWYREGNVYLPTLDEYVGWVCDFLERTPKTCVIDRLSGNLPVQYLIAPEWCLNRDLVHRCVVAELERRGTVQGERVGQP